MSKEVDQRVVEMRFDNKQFEENVKTSMSTLDKLKKALHLDGASSGIENIGKAAKNVDMSSLSGAVETVRVKFSALEVMGVTALANITNSAVNAGKQLVKSLSVDQIMSGYQKYEQETANVQTLMNSTGKSVEEINKYLEKLMWFSDETSYGFTDMTSALSSMVSSGGNIEKLIPMIEGMATATAFAGKGANEFSRVIYNLNQSYGKGYLELIDWKSVENAGATSKQLKELLIETAKEVGTLNKNGRTFFDTLDASITASNFSSSLQDKWVTSEVMEKAFTKFSEYAIAVQEAVEKGDYGSTSEAMEALAGKYDALAVKAFEAAQKAKTFTEAIDATKDAVSSEWKKIWKSMIGDCEQAAETWTDITGDFWDIFVGPLEGVRTEIEDAFSSGGRELLFDTIKNILNGIKGIVVAFQNASTGITSSGLYSFLEKINRISKSLILTYYEGEELKLNEKGQKLSRTLSGISSVFRILGKIIKGAVSTGLKVLSALFGNCGESVLGVTASIGDSISAFEKWLDTNEALKKVINSITKVLVSVASTLHDVVAVPFELISKAIDSLKEKASGLLDKLKEVFSGFSDIDTSGLDSFSERVKARLEPLGMLFDGVKKVFSGILAFFKKLSPIFATLATSIGKAFESLGEAISNAVGNADFDGLLDIVNGGVLVAIGIGIKKFMDSLSSITENAGGMLKSIKGILDGVKGCFEAWQKDIQAKTLLKIAAAIAILTASLIALSLIDSNKLSSALAAVTAEFTELLIALKVLIKTLDGNDTKGMSKAAITMVIMSAAILVLTSAMKKLAELDWDGILKGIAGIAGLSVILVESFKQLSKNTGSITKSAIGLIVFAEAIRLLVEPTKELGALSLESLAKGLVGVGILCAELALFLKGADLDNISLGKGLGLMTLAESVNILASAVGKFAGIDVGRMIQGLAGVAVVLVEVAAFTKSTGDSKKVIRTAIGMVILGSAMLIFGEAIENMGSMSLGQIGKGLLTMSVSLAAVAIAMNNMPTTTPIIATGMVLVGAALKIIASAMSDFGEMSRKEIAKSIITLASSLAIIAVAVHAMEGTLGGSAALLVMAAAIDMLTPALKVLGGMSLAEIGKALLTLAGAFTVIGVAGLVLGPIIPAILALSAAVALLGVGTLACGAGVLVLSAGLAALAAAGTASITMLVLAIEAILSLIPQILTKVGEGIVALLVAIGNAAPELANAVIQIVNAILVALEGTIPQFVTTLVTLLENILITIAEHMPKIMQAGMDIIIAFLEGIRKNIRTVVSTFLGIIVEFIEGVADKLPDVIQSAFDLIISFINGLADAIRNNAEDIRNAAKNLISSFFDAMLTLVLGKDGAEKFKELGKNIIDGIKNGIKKKISDIKDAAKEIGNSLLSGVKDFLGIHSPSKEFTKIGMYSDEGLASGLKKYAGSVSKSARDVASEALDAMDGGLKGMSDLIEDAINGDPTIRPVLDLSNIESGARRIDGLFSNRQAVALATSGILGGQNGNYAPVINMTIHGAQGQDVKQLADLVSERINNSIQRRNNTWR